MTVSIRDVAKAAGVSVSTVSRALNGYTDVSEKTRKKIQQTVQELGYLIKVPKIFHLKPIRILH